MLIHLHLVGEAGGQVAGRALARIGVGIAHPLAQRIGDGQIDVEAIAGLLEPEVVAPRHGGGIAEGALLVLRGIAVPVDDDRGRLIGHGAQLHLADQPRPLELQHRESH